MDGDFAACVVIPVYKGLSGQDMAALDRYKRVFSYRDIWCAIPLDLDP